MDTIKPLIAITGANSGIGKAIAQKFSTEGHPLLLMDLKKDQMSNLSLPNCICKITDVTEWKEVDKAIKEGEKEYGPVHCLVNDAGIALRGMTKDQNPEQWQNVIDVNIKGMLNGTHAVLSKMVSRRSGTIINISSIAGRVPFPRMAIYNGTKHAIHSISETIRQEVAKDCIRVVVISPGCVETNMLNPQDEQDQLFMNNYQNTLGMFLPPKDVANAVWYAYSQPDYLNIREIALAVVKEPY